MKRIALALSALTLGAAIVVTPAMVSAWGNSGHRMVGMAAVRALPDELPAFLRTPGAVVEVGELSREPDRTKGGGQPHDRERDTAHFVDMDEAGHVMDGRGPSIDALPVLKSEYDAVLIAAGHDVNDAGYLPYAIWDGYQQLVRDFATWRVLNAAEARESDPGKRAWYRADRLRREALILRDMGYLSHYVGDAAQPLHTSIHYNGWGRYPNPEGFTDSRQTHGTFEGAFVRRPASAGARLSENLAGRGPALLPAGEGRGLCRQRRPRRSLRHRAAGGRGVGAARPVRSGLARCGRRRDRLAHGQGGRGRGRHGRSVAGDDRRGLSSGFSFPLIPA